MQDRYGYDLSTTSAKARDAYVAAADALLAADHGAIEGFETAVAEDPAFKLGHAGLARARQVAMDGAGAQSAMAAAEAAPGGLTAREASHMAAMRKLIDGPMASYPVLRAHLAEHPRDALIAQPSVGVFGLIGFSGKPGREAELLAYTASLAPHYGDDWWMLTSHGFSLCEAGQTDAAISLLERSLDLNARNANAAHVRAHAYYEAGEMAAGRAFLEEWLPGYDKRGILHSHISWHVALWDMLAGNVDDAWARIDADVGPGGSQGLAINILTDTASVMFRAEAAGVAVPAERWRAMRAFASEFFPKCGIAFADVHAALAHAMAGEFDALAKIVDAPKGPAADVVSAMGHAFEAVGKAEWPEATKRLVASMSDHERIGGSRAQRDLLEHMLLWTLLKQNRSEEARNLLALRRPAQAAAPLVAGL